MRRKGNLFDFAHLAVPRGREERQLFAGGDILESMYHLAIFLTHARPFFFPFIIPFRSFVPIIGSLARPSLPCLLALHTLRSSLLIELLEN
jgi:hypothetical protein